MQYKKISDFPNITTVGSGVYLPAVDPSESLAINQNKKIRVADFLDNYQGFKQSGTGAVSRTVTSKLRDVVSVKDFGAVGDGVADDTAAIQAALNTGRQTGTPPPLTPFYQNKTVVFIPEGTYKVTSSLILPAGVSLQMDGSAELIAAAAMSAVITTEEASYTDLHNFTFIRGGKINCANLAQSAIWVKYFSYFTIDSVQTWNATVQHINLGSLSAPASSYEAIIHNCLLRRDLTAYPTNLVGILFTRCGDSHITDVIIMGVRIGIQGPVYDSKFTRVHVWNPFPISGYANTDNGVGLGVGFSITGGENIFSQCQVDGPLVNSGSGWYFTQPRNSLIGCSINAVEVNDLQCQGAFFDTGAYTTVVGCTFKGGGVSNRLSAEVAGPGVAGSTVIGNFTSNVAAPVGDRGVSISRAWVVYDGTGTPAIRKSKGVSSITDLGTGHWRINFTSPMLNTDYLATFGGHNAGLASNALLIYGDVRSTTSLEVKGWDPVVGALADSTYINVDIKESV